MKRISYLLFSGVFLFSNLSCTKEELCKTLAICDLASKIVIPAATILAGTDLSVLGTLLNIAESSIDCTETAPSSDSDFYPYFRANENSPWQQVTDLKNNNNIIAFPSLSAGAEKTQQRTYLFNEPGQYQFKKNADFNKKVPERIETNNNFEITVRAAALTSNNEYVSEVITVLPNPSRPYDSSKPKIELIAVKWIN